MTLPEFIEALFSDGRLRISSSLNINEDDLDQARTTLIEFEAIDRQQQPAGLPEFHVEVALKAATTLFHAAVLLVHREFSEDDVKHVFARQPQFSSSPQDHYSVDLVFRFAPDLLRMASEASANDVLTQELVRTMNGWPLSSVGITLCEPPVLHPVFQDVGLRRLFVDRITARKDKRAADEPILWDHLKAISGAYPELIPWLQDRPT